MRHSGWRFILLCGLAAVSVACTDDGAARSETGDGSEVTDGATDGATDSSSSGDDATDGVDADATEDAESTSGSTTDGTDGTDDDGSEATETGGEEPTPVCLAPCVTAADCDLGSPPFDGDNYTCDGGACVYAGCNSDQECAALGDQVCHPSDGGVDYCALACATAADCDQGSAPFDADNYACEGGACVYTGCNSDQECEALVGDYICASIGGSIDVCAVACASAADCDLGQAAHDADNYSCEGGACVYTGCNSDRECAQTQPGYVCR